MTAGKVTCDVAVTVTSGWVTVTVFNWVEVLSATEVLVASCTLVEKTVDSVV